MVTVSNEQIAEHLNTIASYYELLSISWKPRAFEKAARVVAALEDSVQMIFERDGSAGLLDIESVGKGIAQVIEDFLTTQSSEELRELEEKVPSGLLAVMRVQGVGPKKAYHLYKEIGIDSLDSLEEAARSGKIRVLKGFGAKSEEAILSGISLAREGQERKLLGVSFPLAQQLAASLRALPSVSKVEVAGSVRRMRETSKDIDILVVANDPVSVFDAASSFPEVASVLSRGETKAALRLRQGINCDIRIVSQESFGAALQYFTGSKDHNVAVRKIAVRKGYKLSEYGLFDAKTDKKIAGETETGIYSALGLVCVPPELRENLGEVHLKQVPRVVSLSDIKGDLHTHTTQSDGKNSPEEMIAAALERGYSYYAFTDHSASERIQNGLDVQRLQTFFKEVDMLQKKYSELTLLKGSEVSILKDGSLDYPDTVLSSMDVVVASVHSHFGMSSEEMTKRLLCALSHSAVRIFGHPTGRMINRRKPYEFDHDAVFSFCKKRNIALEINSNYHRLDLNDVLIRSALGHGCFFVINTDAHAVPQLDYMFYGVSQARRAWLPASHVINTFTKEKLFAWLRR